MTLPYKSETSQLSVNSGNSPPSFSTWGVDELEIEYNNDEYDDDEFEAYDPISTPFISQEFHNNNNINNNDHSNNNNINKSNVNGQFPKLAFVASALRKSLLVTCSAERDDHNNINININDDNNNNNSNVISCFNELEISSPTNVRHVSHVTFDRFRGFLGLPNEFHSDVLRRVPSASVSVFGVSPQSMQCSFDERGNSVPTILLRMQRRLYAEGGLRAEGLFRITAENGQEERVRSQLNKGIVPQGIDVHCLAGLIKAWLRELPKGVLDCLTPEQVMECNTEDECTQLVKLLPPMEAALLDWAINLMADVVQNEQFNKMNARNIAMVFAPNMTQMADPLTALIHAVQVMNFLKALIVRTLRLREESAEKVGFLSLCSDSSDTTRRTPRKSITFGELLSQTRHEMNTPTDDQIHMKKPLNSATLGQLDCIPEKKHCRSQKTNSNEGKTYTSTSYTAELGDDDREVEAGILERLHSRKGVKYS